MRNTRSFLPPDRVFEKLGTFCVRRKIEPSTVLFRQGEAPREVSLVLRGVVALTPDAREIGLCRVAKPGSVLGLPANLRGKPYSLTAVAAEPCEIAVVPRRRFLEILRADSEMTLGIVQMLADENAEMQNLVVQFRLAHLSELAVQ